MPTIAACPLHKLSEILQIDYATLRDWAQHGLIAPSRKNDNGIEMYDIKTIQKNQADIERTWQRISDSMDLGMRKEMLAQEIAGLIEKSRRQPARPEDVMAVQAKKRELAKLESRTIRPQRRSVDEIQREIDETSTYRDVLEQRAKKSIADYDIAEYHKAVRKVKELQKELASQQSPEPRDTSELETQLATLEIEAAKLRDIAKRQPTNDNLLRWGSAESKVKAVKNMIQQ